MKKMDFTASHGLYALAGGTNDMANQLSARLVQLEAMLVTTYGESGRVFRDDLTGDTQDAFMWACYSLANEARQLFDEIMERGGK